MGKLSHIVKAIDAANKRKIEAYHGTPHEFDKFSSDKIGTGEGAQAYGHGLYFAERKGVAEGYRKALGDFVIDGKPIDRNNPLHVAASFIEDEGGDITKGLNAAKTDLKNLETRFADDPFMRSDIDFMRDVVKSFDSLELPRSVQKGNLYKVELDVSDDDLLDWDKPIDDNRAKDIIKKALKESPTDESKQFQRNILSKDIDNYSNFTGRHLYQTLSMALDKNDLNKAMQNSGFKGIKYSDAQSRGTGAGTSNFVIFDDSLISIAEKNGIPFKQVEDLAAKNGITKQQALSMIMGGGAIGAGMQSQDAEANSIYPSQESMASELNKPKPLNQFVEKRKQRANSLVNRIGYVAEPLATIATGYGADVLGGLAGAVTMPFVGADKAAQNVEMVQKAMPMYLPQTQGGNQAFEDLGGLIDKGAHMYNFTADKTGVDPMANFEQSAEYLHKKKLNALAATLKGLPEIL